MKHDAFGFDFPVFNVHLVATEDDGNVLTDTDQVTMPVWHVFIGDPRSDIEHDDSTLSCGDNLPSFNMKYFAASDVSKKQIMDRIDDPIMYGLVRLP